ncbi:ImmA/IrrE family metallo-endopeptidase [Kineococcus glutinatus]|uniref:IrrE N-terminal-like domain-containing protein n=1 Tax=Kineococcus glutinatus TaxID=1070872 RepID=A0ABP9HEV4_9ACTN
MHDKNEEELAGASVLAALRRLIPERQVHYAEALQVAELQAARLRRLTDVGDEPVTCAVIAGLPRFEVVQRRLPTSGMSYWNGRVWVICLNGGEPLTRQRFTLLHEFKHIIDHGRAERLYAPTPQQSAEALTERACDYFAGCVLMPKALMKRAWGDGLQRPSLLAAHFDVSPRAAAVRLAQLGLTEPVARCVARYRAHRRNWRPSHDHFSPARRPVFTPTEVPA